MHCVLYAIVYTCLAWPGLLFMHMVMCAAEGRRTSGERKNGKCAYDVHTHRDYLHSTLHCARHIMGLSHMYISIQSTRLPYDKQIFQSNCTNVHWNVHSNRIESRHRQGAKSWTRKRDWEEEEAGGTQCDWAQNLIAILNRRNQLNDDIKCMQYRATNDTNNPSKMNSSSGSEIVL